MRSCERLCAHFEQICVFVFVFVGGTESVFQLSTTLANLNDACEGVKEQVDARSGVMSDSGPLQTIRTLNTSTPCIPSYTYALPKKP